MRLVTLSLDLVKVDDLGDVLVEALLDVGGESVYELSPGEIESGGFPLSVQN